MTSLNMLTEYKYEYNKYVCPIVNHVCGCAGPHVAFMSALRQCAAGYMCHILSAY